jgi:hypothetical protein
VFGFVRAISHPYKVQDQSEFRQHKGRKGADSNIAKCKALASRNAFRTRCYATLLCASRAQFWPARTDADGEQENGFEAMVAPVGQIPPESLLAWKSSNTTPAQTMSSTGQGRKKADLGERRLPERSNGAEG